MPFCVFVTWSSLGERTERVQWAEFVQLPYYHPDAVSLPLLNGSGQENEVKNLMGCDKGRETANSYSHEQNRLDFRMMSIIHCQLKMEEKVGNQNWSNPLLHPRRNSSSGGTGLWGTEAEVSLWGFPPMHLPRALPTLVWALSAHCSTSGNTHWHFCPFFHTVSQK